MVALDERAPVNSPVHGDHTARDHALDVEDLLEGGVALLRRQPRDDGCLIGSLHGHKEPRQVGHALLERAVCERHDDGAVGAELVAVPGNLVVGKAQRFVVGLEAKYLSVGARLCKGRTADTKRSFVRLNKNDQRAIENIDAMGAKANIGVSVTVISRKCAR